MFAKILIIPELPKQTVGFCEKEIRTGIISTTYKGRVNMTRPLLSIKELFIFII